MPRHSKNPTSKGTFTYHERQQLEYGTSKVRLGKDSIKDFDSCSICLGSLIMPQCCNKGHLFCKECILTSLLKQKKLNKEREKQWEQQQLKIKNEEERKRIQQEENKLKEFESNNVTFLDNTNNTDNSNTTSTTTSTNSNNNDSNNNNNNNNNNIVQEKELKLNSFWAASLIPKSHDKVIEKPTMHTICPEGNHPLLSKQLITVKFKSIPKSSTKTNTNNDDDDDVNNGYCCPICEKTLTNTHKLKLLKNCGHVFCAPCLDQFSSNGSNKKKTQLLETKECLVCQKEYDNDQIISLQQGGTGFAAGGSELIAKKYTPTALI